ncbi:MAG TPA: DNA primase [Candidatus Caccenecus avistercoris]|nr:DNA primase [Candidatus Caccenecus avistercoris]
MVTDNEIEQIRKSANIIDIISSYIPLTQKGKNYFGVCPFHEDHSPSMSVSEEKQIYKCFSCGAAGNVFTFVSEYENVKFLEAVKIVADKCGIPFHGTITKERPKVNKEEYEIMSLALKFYQNNLQSTEGKAAKEYLKKRALDETVIKEFDLGLALGGNVSLNKLLLSKKYSTDTLIKLGLVNEHDGYINDIFKYRVMFPIHDLDGNVVGFTGRIYENNDQAKYINSKESVIFKKGQILFNYHRAKSEIKRKKEVILVEGNMDAIRMYSSGIKNVLALMGTSLTKEQVSIIKSLRANIILMFDNDNAGEIATYQNGTILEEAGLNPQIVRISGPKDPDEYIIKNGAHALMENIRSPISFLDFKVKYFKKDKDLSKVDDLASYIKEIIKDLKNLPDELTRELTLKRISEDYDVSLDLLHSELAKLNVKKTNESPPKKLAKMKFSKYDKACQNILYFMMNDGKFVEKFKKELGYFDEKKYRSLANEIIYFYETNKNIELSSFISFISTKDYIVDDAMEIIKGNKAIDLEMNAFEEFINVAKNEMVKLEIKDLKNKIANSMDVSEELELAQKLLNLKKGCVGNEK